MLRVARQSPDSSSSSAEEDDDNTLKLAQDLARRLVQDAERGVESIVELPFRLAAGGIESLENVARNWLDQVLGANRQRNEERLEQAAKELAKVAGSIIRKTIEDAGEELLRPLRLKITIVRTVAAGIRSVLRQLVPGNSNLRA